MHPRMGQSKTGKQEKSHTDTTKPATGYERNAKSLYMYTYAASSARGREAHQNTRRHQSSGRAVPGNRTAHVREITYWEKETNDCWGGCRRNRKRGEIAYFTNRGTTLLRCRYGSHSTTRYMRQMLRAKNTRGARARTSSNEKITSLHDRAKNLGGRDG